MQIRLVKKIAPRQRRMALFAALKETAAVPLGAGRQRPPCLRQATVFLHLTDIPESFVILVYTHLLITEQEKIRLTNDRGVKHVT